MTLQELQTKFPIVHEMFVDSPEFTPPRPGDISGDLIRFLWARGFHAATSHTPPPSKRSRKRISYGCILIVHGDALDLDHKAFDTVDEAREFVLDHALGMFAKEEKISA